jgi:hypothetical protein
MLAALSIMGIVIQLTLAIILLRILCEEFDHRSNPKDNNE